MNQRYLIFAIVASLVSIIAACGGSSRDSSVDREAIKTNYVDMAYAAYTDSLTTATALQSSIDTFIADPTDANLASAKAAYKQARIPYQQSEIMRWDTAITVNADLGGNGGPSSVDDWEGQVNAWPLDENHIVEIIQSDVDITIALLLAQNGADDNEANVTTGVHAIEFMLWGEDTNGVNPGAGERPATDFANDGSCVDAYCARRASYLKAAADLLVADLTEMQSEWQPESKTAQGTLAYNFLNSDTALDYILGSMRAMATDELASARMSSGLELGDPEEEHDCFSDLSHVAIYYNFQGVRNAFYGHYGDVSGPSLADLIQERDLVTFTLLDQAFDDIEQKMAQILELGERDTNPIRFDQIIGQSANGSERLLAESAVDELIALDTQFNAVKELLSLTEIDTDGGGDGD